MLHAKRIRPSASSAPPPRLEVREAASPGVSRTAIAEVSAPILNKRGGVGSEFPDRLRVGMDNWKELPLSEVLDSKRPFSSSHGPLSSC